MRVLFICRRYPLLKFGLLPNLPVILTTRGPQQTIMSGLFKLSPHHRAKPLTPPALSKAPPPSNTYFDVFGFASPSARLTFAARKPMRILSNILCILIHTTTTLISTSVLALCPSLRRTALVGEAKQGQRPNNILRSEIPPIFKPCSWEGNPSKGYFAHGRTCCEDEV